MKTTNRLKDYKYIISLNKQTKPTYTFFLDNNMDLSKSIVIENIKSNIKSLFVKKDIYLSHPSKLFDDIKKKFKPDQSIKPDDPALFSQGKTIVIMKIRL